MKSVWKPQYLPFLLCLLGIGGLVLRFWLFAAPEGFSTTGHPSAPLTWILTVAALGILLLGILPLQKAPSCAYNFPRSLPSGVGLFLGAVAIGITAFRELAAGSGFFLRLSAFVGIGCVPILIFLGICRIQGRQGNLLLYGILCIYAMLHLIGTYQMWSANPHTLQYCFSILFQICWMLALYFRAGFEAGEGSRQGYTFFQLATIYFALLVLPGNDPILPGGVALWMLASPCNLIPFTPERSQKS